MASTTHIYWNVDEKYPIDSDSTRKMPIPVFFYGTEPKIIIYLRDRDGAVWTGLAELDTAGVTVDHDDWDTTDDLAGEADPGDISVDETLGTITVDAIDLFTAAFATQIGTSEKINARLEVQITSSGDTSPSRIFSIPCYMHNVNSTQAGSPAAPLSNFYTKVETDALVAAKADAVGTADIEITDATKGLILRFSDGTRIRIRGYKDGTVVTILTEEVV